MKSMITRQTFDNYQEMYQRAQVLDEIGRENKVVFPTKRKFEHDNRSQKSRNPKRFNSRRP